MNIQLELPGISKVLAKKWGVSVSDAVIASLLHDIGKSITNQQMLSLALKNNIAIYDFELLENRSALHGKISALFFEKEFEGNDEQRIKLISHAISTHVAGDMDMNTLDKIVFIADNLESKKESVEMLEKIKKGQIYNPDYYIKEIIKQKIQRNENRGNQHYNPFLDAMVKDEGVDR